MALECHEKVVLVLQSLLRCLGETYTAATVVFVISLKQHIKQ